MGADFSDLPGTAVLGAILCQVDDHDVTPTFFPLLGLPTYNLNCSWMIPALYLLGYGRLRHSLAIEDGSDRALTYVPFYKVSTLDTPSWLDAWIQSDMIGKGGTHRTRDGPYGFANFFHLIIDMSSLNECIWPFLSQTLDSTRVPNNDTFEDIHQHAPDEGYDTTIFNDAASLPYSIFSSLVNSDGGHNAQEQALDQAQPDECSNPKRSRSLSDTSASSSAAGISPLKWSKEVLDICDMARQELDKLVLIQPFSTTEEKTSLLVMAIGQVLEEKSLSLPKGVSKAAAAGSLGGSLYSVVRKHQNHVTNIIFTQLGISGDTQGPKSFDGISEKTADQCYRYTRELLGPSSSLPGISAFAVKDEINFTSNVMTHALCYVKKLAFSRKFQGKGSSQAQSISPESITDQDIDATYIFIHKSLVKIQDLAKIEIGAEQADLIDLESLSPLPLPSREDRIFYVRQQRDADPRIDQILSAFCSSPPKRAKPRPHAKQRNDKSNQYPKAKKSSKKKAKMDASA
ncbi:hypothetical protein HWV62_13711 [Athelia sp. TMB]|nr:hypothetical protein HWV62_13711 [Athelia sp. TMB]